MCTPPQPPAPGRDERPDQLHDAERPGALQKAVSRGREAGARECQHEPRGSRLQRAESSIALTARAPKSVSGSTSELPTDPYA
jgi:hypothetical protein